MTAIEARYDGVCSECEEWFTAGTQIVRNESGRGWLHATCPDPIDTRDRRGSVCPLCFMEKSLSGECGCES